MTRLSRLIANRYIIYAMHVLFWMVLIVPFLSGPSHSMGFEQMKYRIIFNNSFLILLFYFNAYYLYPEVYKKKGWLHYALTVIITLGLLLYTSSYILGRWLPMPQFPHPVSSDGGPLSADHPFSPGRPFPNDQHFDAKPGYYPPPGGPRGFLPFPIYIFIIGISFSYRLMMDQNKEEKRRKEQETENLKTELNFLRSQISPHFMFNVLNTLVAMARKKSDLMEPSLIQLSTLMRYVLHESNNNRIPLDKEVEYLKNYIDLQSLRFGDDIKLVLDIDPATEGYEIEPMLLIPFVENAFKHGLIVGEDALLVVQLKIVNASLAFRVENKIAPLNDSRDTSSGIGLKNVSRRLELLYTDKYTLNTMIVDNVFIAELNLQFQ